MIERRDLLFGAGLAGALTASSGLSACSPSADSTFGIPSKDFFGLIARRKLDEAADILHEKSKLTFVKFDDLKIVSGPKNIVGEISNLLHSQGMRMIGASSDNATVGFWGSFGGWYTTDIINGNVVELETHDCGVGELSHSVINVYVDNKKPKISQIVLMESQNLSYSRDPEARYF